MSLSQETSDTSKTVSARQTSPDSRLALWREQVAARLSHISRTEWLFFGLLVLCYVYFLEPAGTNTLSRYDMVWALSHGTASIDHFCNIHLAINSPGKHCNTIDFSYYNGHYFSPRSIGLSLLAVPVLKVLLPLLTHPRLSIQIAFLTLFTVVPVALIATIVFYRFILRLRPSLAGTPIPFIVTTAFALGTLQYPFGVSFFSHALGGGLMLCGFYLLYRARTAIHPEWFIVLAGLLVGFAVISEYPTGLIMLALGGYVLAVFPGRRIPMLLYFGLAMVPSALLLGWYDWFAFGNPFHLSYDSVVGFSGQHQGFFGITLPQLDGLRQILVWPRGLLVESPFLVFVVLGFVRWWRSSVRPSPELLVCLAISIIYPLAISSYFLPMAGENLPGPRLLVPMLPFACLALAWAVDLRQLAIRGLFALLLVFGVVVSYLYLILGVREYHTYLTYPISDLFIPVLRTGKVPVRNGPTPVNIATHYFSVPLSASVLLVFILLLAWTVFLCVSYLLWRPQQMN